MQQNQIKKPTKSLLLVQMEVEVQMTQYHRASRRRIKITPSNPKRPSSYREESDENCVLVLYSPLSSFVSSFTFDIVLAVRFGAHQIENFIGVMVPWTPFLSSRNIPLTLFSKHSTS